MIPWYDPLAFVSAENCANDNLCRNTLEGLRGRHENWYTRQRTIMTPFCCFLVYHRINGDTTNRLLWIGHELPGGSSLRGTIMTPFYHFLTCYRIGGGYDKPIVMNRPWVTGGSFLGRSTSHWQIYFFRNALEETTRTGMLGRKSSGISTRLRKCTSPTFGLETDYTRIHRNWYTRQKTIMTPFCRFSVYYRISREYDKLIVMNRSWATRARGSSESLGWSTSH